MTGLPIPLRRGGGHLKHREHSHLCEAANARLKINHRRCISPKHTHLEGSRNNCIRKTCGRNGNTMITPCRTLFTLFRMKIEIQNIKIIRGRRLYSFV